MATLLNLLPVVLLLQSPPAVQRLTLPVPEGEPVRYALSLPRSRRRTPPALVLALHPGGPRTPYYGAAFVEQIVGPALAGVDAVIVAPDCPAGSWTDPTAEAAVLSVMQQVMSEMVVDRRRVLVVGFSMGARGAWFFAARHPELVTGAVIAAGAPGGEAVDTLARVPTYVIHSRQDEVVPFAPTERAVRDLERLGRQIRFEALNGLGHYDTAKYIPPMARAAKWVLSRAGRR